MKHSILFILVFINVLQMHAQGTTKQASWQQRADYEIKVTLNPVDKTLQAFISIHYFNNSPDTLSSIWFHAWPNAYKNTQTAFALQQLKNGKTEFQFSPEKEKGSIDGFHFVANGDSLLWHFDKTHIDILEVKLNQPLLPGNDLTITTPFKVKLPKLVSRGGYKGSFIAATQWFPKPAVYDINGWNAMPYLDQGEFYSEFGDFKVSITLPEKYLVAATGNLQTLSEIRLLDSIVKKGGRYVNHSNKLKTVSFHENNIHDFAWFADTVFRVDKSSVKLENGDTVNTWIYIGIEEKKVFFKGSPLSPSNLAIKTYSQKIGPYPYKQCTVVIGPVTAGSGMEYPTITVCQRINNGLIAHEIGHNWFYGILGSNERKYPWMDESINTFYEQKLSNNLPKDSSFYKDFKGNNWLDKYESLTGYLFTARQGISQPLNLPSEEFSGINYGSIVYAKGPLLFAYLEQQLGDSVFQKCVQNYYKNWQYKHPLPGDMKSSFESSCGKNLDWFFTDLMNENNTVDIVKTKDGYKVKGSAKLDTFLRKNKGISTNPFGYLPETNYLNNGQKLKLITLGIPLRLPRQNARIAVNLTPVGGYNYYDKIYFGALLYNRTLFRKKFEYVLMPAYATSTGQMVGYGQLNGLFLSKGKTLFKTETGIQGQSFGITTLGQLNQYFRINPYIHFHFKTKGKIEERLEKQLLINLYHTGLRETGHSYSDTNKINYPSNYFFNYIKLTYSILNKSPINTVSFKINTEYGYNYKFNPLASQYIKTWLNTSYKYTYAKKNKYIKTELFAGLFLYKKGYLGNKLFFISGNNGDKDYLYNEAMIGRSEDIFSNNILGKQIINTNGNMRNVIPFLHPTDKWMLTLKNEVCLPGIIPLRVYFDLGYYPYILNTTSNTGTTSQLIKAELYSTAGIILPLLNETLEIFIPFYQSKQFLNYKLYNYSIGNSIGFKLNINKLHPFKLIDNYRP